MTYMGYQLVAVLMNLNVLEGHLPVAGFFIWDTA